MVGRHRPAGSTSRKKGKKGIYLRLTTSSAAVNPSIIHICLFTHLPIYSFIHYIFSSFSLFVSFQSRFNPTTNPSIHSFVGSYGIIHQPISLNSAPADNNCLPMYLLFSSSHSHSRISFPSSRHFPPVFARVCRHANQQSQPAGINRRPASNYAPPPLLPSN